MCNNKPQHYRVCVCSLYKNNTTQSAESDTLVRSATYDLVSYLSITVLDDEQNWRVLALHGSVQGFNTHTMFGSAEGQSPGIANGSRWEILCQLQKTD